MSRPTPDGVFAKCIIAYRNFSANFEAVIRRVKEAEKMEGRPFRRLRVHDLRHGFGIRWLKAGGDIYELKQ